MANVATCSKAQLDWAIGIIDRVGEGQEIDASEFFKATAVVTVVSEAAFSLAGEVEQLRAEVERLKAKVNRLVDRLDLEGVYQEPDRSDYLADREE